MIRYEPADKIQDGAVIQSDSLLTFIQLKREVKLSAFERYDQ